MNARASAHDFWIEARPYNLQSPGPVAISLHVGTELVGDSVPNIPEWYQDFTYIHAGKRASVSGDLGDDPAGEVNTKTPGLYVVGYQNHPEFIELSGEKFEEYLDEEGLLEVKAVRAASGHSDKTAKEFYQRCVKSLIKVGESDVELQVLSAPMGYKLELFPGASPYSNDVLPVQLMFNGLPVSGVLMVAFKKDAPEVRQKVRTDNKGRAVMDISESGVWIVKAVHMETYPGPEADWISYWASLTFEK